MDRSDRLFPMLALVSAAGGWCACALVRAEETRRVYPQPQIPPEIWMKCKHAHMATVINHSSNEIREEGGQRVCVGGCVRVCLGGWRSEGILSLRCLNSHMITCTRPWALRLDFREAQIKLKSRKMTFFREQMKWLMWRFWGAKRETVFCFYSFILKLTLQMFYLYPGSSPLTLRCSRALSDLNSCRHQRYYSLTPLIKSWPLESQVGPIAVRPPSSAQRFSNGWSGILSDFGSNEKGPCENTHGAEVSLIQHARRSCGLLTSAPSTGAISPLSTFWSHQVTNQ